MKPAASSTHAALRLALLLFLLLLSGALDAAGIAAGFVALAPGVFRYDGAALAAAAPGGEAGNVGLVVGSEGALLIDSGASHRQGREVLAALLRVTDRPAQMLLISHGGPEFLFGASALQDAGVAVVMQRATAELVARRCAGCLDRAREAEGVAAMAGSRVPVANGLVQGDLKLDLGGREVSVLDLGWASLPGELAVFDPASGTLFGGGVVLSGRIPVLRDGKLADWLGALDRLAALPVRRIVPGFGPVGGREAVARLRAYLSELDAEVRRRYTAGLSLAAATAAVNLPAYADWAGYPEVHRQNVHHLYLELEGEELSGMATQAAAGR